MSIKIGIQGAKGSFSEEAAHEFAKRNKLTDYQLDYLISSEAVLSALDSDHIDYGLFAMENAQGGVVIESVKALAKYRCHINDMFHVRISQNLLVYPGTKPSEITAIYSHQQALRQCRNYLADHYWSCPLKEAEDTADSARKLQEGELPYTAGVIANKVCAELYGLEIIEADIHDLKNNLTLFIGATKFKEENES